MFFCLFLNEYKLHYRGCQLIIYSNYSTGARRTLPGHRYSRPQWFPAFCVYAPGRWLIIYSKFSRRCVLLTNWTKKAISNPIVEAHLKWKKPSRLLALECLSVLVFHHAQTLVLCFGSRLNYSPSSGYTNTKGNELLSIYLLNLGRDPRLFENW